MSLIKNYNVCNSYHLIGFNLAASHKEDGLGRKVAILLIKWD